MPADWKLILADPAAGIALRAITDGDRPFLSMLYASTRADELAVLDWSEAQKASFLDSQFQAQHTHYQSNYRNAEFLLVLQRSEAIGRIYVDQGREELRLMEISLLRSIRGKGLGGAMIDRLLDQADRLGLVTGLHVEAFNPAIHMYLRRGFEIVETRGVYEYMQRRPDRAAERTPDQENTAS